MVQKEWFLNHLSVIFHFVFRFMKPPRQRKIKPCSVPKSLPNPLFIISFTALSLLSFTVTSTIPPNNFSACLPSQPPQAPRQRRVPVCCRTAQADSAIPYQTGSVTLSTEQPCRHTQCESAVLRRLRYQNLAGVQRRYGIQTAVSTAQTCCFFSEECTWP